MRKLTPLVRAVGPRRADTLIFGHDMDDNRMEEVRDFRGAAGNKSSYTAHWGLFGQGGGFGHHDHLTPEDIPRPTFKPRRKMECPHLDSLAGEIIHMQPEDAQDTQYVSHPIFENAAGSNSLRAAEVAAHQADLTSRPRRTNRMGMNSSVDKVVFGIDLDKCACTTPPRTAHSAQRTAHSAQRAARSAQPYAPPRCASLSVSHHTTPARPAATASSALPALL